MKKFKINTRWLSYGVVIVLGIAGGLLDRYSDLPLVEKYIPNVNSEILGIFITIALIENLLHFDAKRRNKKMREVALRKLQIPVRGLAELFAQMIKASLKTPFEKYPKTFAELFSDKELYTALHNLNFASEAPVVPKRDWYRYTYEVLDLRLKQIEEISMGYMEFFSPEEIDVIDTFTQSQLVVMTKGLVNVPNVLKGAGHSSALPLLSCIEKNKLGEEIKKLIDLLSITSDISISESFWLDTVRPKIGESWMQEIPLIQTDVLPLTT